MYRYQVHLQFALNIVHIGYATLKLQTLLFAQFGFKILFTQPFGDFRGHNHLITEIPQSVSLSHFTSNDLVYHYRLIAFKIKFKMAATIKLNFVRNSHE